MYIQYSKWVENLDSWEDRLDGLISLFNYILMQVEGDVDEALEWMQYVDQKQALFTEDLTMQDFIDELKARGYIREDDDSNLTITAKGNQRIRKDALDEIFGGMQKSQMGMHETPHLGLGVERLSETKNFKFGDVPSNIDLTSTLTNAYRRSGINEFSLHEEDVEVFETEHTSSAATVLMLDISHSMVLYGEDRITPAKQVALALCELIQTRYPKDRLHVLLFGDDAREISFADIPFVNVGPFHTNTRQGLRLARSLLKHSGNANKQIFMVTDGKPSAIFDENGRIYKNSFGLDPKIVNKTLDEAAACRKEGIVVSTFMVARDSYLIDFVEELTKTNKGRAYFTGLGKLGEFVLVDYIRNRRKKLR
jgi:Ca-activated chloride channel homolog